ncbi:MAG: hypothetical protein QOJ27_1022 [Sphingomonadales bacterium]|jgi:hypothetical protein|nr:hypothetical protein [Sphingomonadales bacterium]
MALGKAILTGLVASLAIPYVFSGDQGQLGTWSRIGLVRFTLGDTPLGWSLPLFAAVTLFAWLFLSWAER